MAVPITKGKRKSRSVGERETASLEDVSRALAENKFSRRMFCGADLTDLILATLIFAVLFVLLGAGVSEARRQKAAMASVADSAFVLELYPGAADAQIQPFLQALLGLPEVKDVAYVTRETMLGNVGEAYPKEVVAIQSSVGGNPFNDRVEVTLKSGADAGAFFAFLKKKQLQSLLDPRYLWRFPEQVERRRDAARSHGALYALFILLVVFCFIAVVASSAQYVLGRAKSMGRQIRTLRMLGADKWMIYKPFIGEISVLLASGAVLASYSHVFLIS